MDQPRPKRLTELLQEGFDSFSRSQKAIARYIIDHLEETGYLSADEVARQGNTSSSTVVRFAQSLGFSGYPALQKAARDEYRLGATAKPVVHEDQLLFMVEEDFLTRVLRTDAVSLEETIRKNSLDHFAQVCEALIGARSLGVVGMHEAGIVARYAEYLFEVLGKPTWVMSDGSEDRAARLARLGEEDALLAIGFRGAHTLTVAAARQAAAQGVPVIVITDNSLAELAGIGWLTLYADIDSTFFAHSLVGPLSLVGALAASIYAADRETHDDRLRRLRSQIGESAWLK